MKQNIKTLGILQILLLYCFVMLLNSAPAFSANSQYYVHGTPAQQGFNTEANVNALCHTVRTDNVSSNTTSFVIKFKCDCLFNVILREQRSAAEQLRNYQFFSENILLRLTQREIIFPFHYFW